MKIWVGVTDWDWFRYHYKNGSEELNFWQPKGGKPLRAVDTGAPFLFKLKKPYNHVAGLGFYVTHTVLPLSIAWQNFGTANGTDSFPAFRRKIGSISGRQETDPNLGCIVLTDPLFFAEKDWIDMGRIWSKNIVRGKTYDTGEAEGNWLWRQVMDRIERYSWWKQNTPEKENELTVGEHEEEYQTVIKRARLGQGAFRSLILNAYNQGCAMTGEKTLPALEAGHIKEHASSGPYKTSNGLLLRADLHNLFDTGYLTVTPNYHIEVSSSIKEDFDNGEEYNQLHGKPLPNLPQNPKEQPGKDFIMWHNEKVFRTGG